MIELLPAPAPNVVAFRVGGTIEEKAIERILAAIDAALAEHETVSL